jgi:hypothetical protein
MTSIRCRRTGSGSLSRISPSSSLAGFDGVFDRGIILLLARRNNNDAETLEAIRRDLEKAGVESNDRER